MAASMWYRAEWGELGERAWRRVGGGGGFSVPSGAWGVGQEHSSLRGDIHLHPSAHLFSASGCQDNQPAAQARLSSGGWRGGRGGE